MPQQFFKLIEISPLTGVDLMPYWNVRIIQHAAQLHIAGRLLADATVTPA